MSRVHRGLRTPHSDAAGGSPAPWKPHPFFRAVRNAYRYGRAFAPWRRPDPTLVIDPAGTVIAWNRGMEASSRVPKEETLGHGNDAYAAAFYGSARPIDLVIPGRRRASAPVRRSRAGRAPSWPWRSFRPGTTASARISGAERPCPSRRLERMARFTAAVNGLETEWVVRIFEMFRCLHTYDTKEGAGLARAVV